MAENRKKISPSRKRNKIVKDCSLCLGEGYSIVEFGETFVVLPCSCVKKKIIEKTLH